MAQKKRTNLNQVAALSILALGAALVAVSTFNASSFLAILGLALAFLGAILVYITPTKRTTKRVPISMIYGLAEMSASNIERIINEAELSLNGIYLPPRNLKNVDSSLVFIPEKSAFNLPSPAEITDTLTTTREEGVLIVPPGAALCRLFEQELKGSFTKLDLMQLQAKLPKLLVKDMKLAESAEIEVNGNIVTIELRGSVLDEVCKQMDNQPRTHKLIGCLLSSTIACALAKTLHEPVIILDETRTPETKNTQIRYQFLAIPPSNASVKSSLKSELTDVRHMGLQHH